eukprot:g18475.t1
MEEHAMQEAKTAGDSEAVSYMVVSSIVRERGEKQLEAKNMLTQALKLSFEMMERVRRERRRIKGAEGGWVMMGGILSMRRTEEDIEKIMMDRDERYAKAANPRSLLGCMGDKQMPSHEILAQNILIKKFDKPKVRDEVYLQITKQLTNNPHLDSTAKGWQTMSMCCSSFLPSMDFEN